MCNILLFLYIKPIYPFCKLSAYHFGGSHLNRAILYPLLFVMLILFNASCKKDLNDRVIVNKTGFGKLSDGKEVNMYTLTNPAGLEIRIINYGAIVQSLKVPDRNGRLEDVVLGYDTLDEYVKASPYFGAIVGRYGNRIARGKFTLDGREYSLPVNNGVNHLHGGPDGFDRVFWEGELIEKDGLAGVKLTYRSPDGDEGYPGNLTATVVYTLTDKNELRIEYSAVTDKPTVCNLTHHSYFNLTGNFDNTILGHQLWINADQYTPVDDGLIPTGQLENVAGTPFDFTSPEAIGTNINHENTQLKYGQGYDHNWCLDDVDGMMKLQASLYEPQSGRFMEIITVEPGLQFYSGNFLDGSITGKNGQVYNFRTGLCLETQHFPDSPNQPDFPSTVLRPGEEYKTETIYRFSVK